MPDATCGGQRGFVATVVVTNIGAGTLPAGDLLVRWTDFTTNSSQNQSNLHGGIPPGGSIVYNRNYFLGPCDCVSPPTNFEHLFFAIVDPDNEIVETRENNNASRRYVVCDGC